MKISMKNTKAKLISLANRWWSFLLFALFVVGILWFGGGIGPPAAATEIELQVRPIPVATISAQQADSYEIKRSYLGQIESQRQSLLSFEIPGKLLVVHVDEGEMVEKGQLLAELDTQILVSQKNSLTAQVAAAKSKLDELVKGARIEVLAAAKADVENWQAQRNLAESRVRRFQKLVESSAIARQEYDDARFGKQAAEARLATAQARLEELNNGTRQEQIASQQAIWQRLKADQETVEIQIQKSNLLAPYKGTISRRNLDEGAVLLTGQVVLEMFDHKNMEARVGLPAQIVQQARIDTAIEFKYRDQTFSAAFKTVRPAKNPTTRTVDVIYSLEDQTTPSIIGDVIELRRNQEIKETGFWLPADSLVENYRGLWGCFIAKDSGLGEEVKAELLELELLHQQGNRVYVAGAIKPGDQVIVSGVHRIVDGQVVQAMPISNSATFDEIAVQVPHTSARASLSTGGAH